MTDRKQCHIRWSKTLDRWHLHERRNYYTKKRSWWRRSQNQCQIMLVVDNVTYLKAAKNLLKRLEFYIKKNIYKEVFSLSRREGRMLVLPSWGLEISDRRIWMSLPIAWYILKKQSNFEVMPLNFSSFTKDFSFATENKNEDISSEVNYLLKAFLVPFIM